MEQSKIESLIAACLEWALHELGEQFSRADVSAQVHGWLFGRKALADGRDMGLITSTEMAAAIADRFAAWTGERLGRQVVMSAAGDTLSTRLLRVIES